MKYRVIKILLSINKVKHLKFIYLKQDFRKGSASNPFTPIDLYGHYGVNYPLNLDNNSYIGLSRDDFAKLSFLGKSKTLTRFNFMFLVLKFQKLF